MVGHSDNLSVSEIRSVNIEVSLARLFRSQASGQLSRAMHSVKQHSYICIASHVLCWAGEPTSHVEPPAWQLEKRGEQERANCEQLMCDRTKIGKKGQARENQQQRAVDQTSLATSSGTPARSDPTLRLRAELQRRALPEPLKPCHVRDSARFTSLSPCCLHTEF